MRHRAASPGEAISRGAAPRRAANRCGAELAASSRSRSASAGDAAAGGRWSASSRGAVSLLFLLAVVPPGDARSSRSRAASCAGGSAAVEGSGAGEAGRADVSGPAVASVATAFAAPPCGRYTGVFRGRATHSAAAVAAVASGTTQPSRHRRQTDSVTGSAGVLWTKTATIVLHRPQSDRWRSTVAASSARRDPELHAASVSPSRHPA